MRRRRRRRRRRKKISDDCGNDNIIIIIIITITIIVPVRIGTSGPSVAPRPPVVRRSTDHTNEHCTHHS
jgi:hypothetical protein